MHGVERRARARRARTPCKCGDRTRFVGDHRARFQWRRPFPRHERRIVVSHPSPRTRGESFAKDDGWPTSNALGATRTSSRHGIRTQPRFTTHFRYDDRFHRRCLSTPYGIRRAHAPVDEFVVRIGPKRSRPHEFARRSAKYVRIPVQRPQRRPSIPELQQ